MIELPGTSQEILELLKREPRQTPKSIMESLGTGESKVRNALVVLSELELVKKRSRGLYEISRLGVRHLENLQRI